MPHVWLTEVQGQVLSPAQAPDKCGSAPVHVILLQVGGKAIGNHGGEARARGHTAHKSCYFQNVLRKSKCLGSWSWFLVIVTQSHTWEEL